MTPAACWRWPMRSPHPREVCADSSPAYQRSRHPVRRAHTPRLRNRIVRTPHLDRLAARGTRFASAYCQTPICVPSRGSLATGRWPHTIDSWDNATPYVGAEALSWGHRLTAQGYHVTTVGKL